MDNELKQALEAMEKRVTERTDRHFEQVFERINSTETKLLNAFYGWAKPVESRLKIMPSIDERLGFMEERISAVERKLLERGL
jgi:hypothetical protein